MVPEQVGAVGRTLGIFASVAAVTQAIRRTCAWCSGFWQTYFGQKS
jgi:hypothetical protein